MTLMRALRLLLALALLGAQQLALSHQISHVGKQTPAQERICCHHDALGTVAGGLDAPAALFTGEAPTAFSFASLALRSAATPALAPRCQGPPAFL